MARLYHYGITPKNHGDYPMKSRLVALALAIASTSAFGHENHDYAFKTVAATGQTIGGYQLTGFGDPALNNANDIVFNGYVKAPIGSSTYFAGLFSPTALVVPTNGFLPACLGPYQINDAGQIAFVENSKLSPSEPSVSGVYESSFTGGAVKTILAPGSTIDGVQQTANICSNTANSIGGIFAFNDPGRITFLNTGGFYQYTPAKGLKNISITELDGQPLVRLQLVDGNSRERLFIGSTSPSFSAIFAKDHILVKIPKTIDGADVTDFVLAVASRDSKLAFEGLIGPASAQDFGLFTKEHLVAKSGQTIGGKVISTAGAPFLGLPAVNNRGEVVFTALTGDGTSPNDLAIFTRDAVIVAVGDSIDGKTITALGQPALNDFGVIAFLATFSDGSQEIIEATCKWCR
jgi:hypothetical protein